MRMYSLVAGILACMVSSVAYAETWVGHQVFVSGTNTCANFRTVDYTYTFDGKKLNVRNPNGNLGNIDVPANGIIENAPLKSPTGTLLKFSGNVLTKQLVVSNDLNCRWKTEPKQ